MPELMQLKEEAYVDVDYTKDFGKNIREGIRAFKTACERVGYSQRQCFCEIAIGLSVRKISIIDTKYYRGEITFTCDATEI